MHELLFDILLDIDETRRIAFPSLYLYGDPVIKDLGSCCNTFFTITFHTHKDPFDASRPVPTDLIDITLHRYSACIGELNVNGIVSLPVTDSPLIYGRKFFRYTFRKYEMSHTFQMYSTFQKRRRKLSNYRPTFLFRLKGRLQVSQCTRQSFTSGSLLTSVDNIIVSSNDDGHTELEMPDAFRLLSSNLQSLLVDKSLSDVKLKCGSVVLHAHRCILSVRSPVFRAMFEHTEMEETAKREVNITDLDSRTVLAMLTYIYCGRVVVSDISTATELLYAADKYQLQELKSACSTYLKSSISNDNVLSLLRVGELLEEDLKSRVFEYISEHFHSLVDTEEWKTLKDENPNLILDVVCFVINVNVKWGTV